MKAKALAVAAVIALAPALAIGQDAMAPATPEAPAIGAEVGAAADFDMFLQSFGAADYASAEHLRSAIEYADADMYREKSQRKSRIAS